MATIKYSRSFLKSLKKLPHYIQNKANEKEKVFMQNPFNASLYTHKLHGKEKEHWAYSIDNIYRIKFLFSFAEYPAACCGDEGEENPA